MTFTDLYYILILFAIDATLVLPSEFKLLHFFFFCAVSVGCPVAGRPKRRTTGAQICESPGRTVSEIHRHFISTWVAYRVRYRQTKFFVA